MLLLVPAVYASTVTRSFTPKKAMHGDTVTVMLALDEVAQELSYVIEESVPEGWTVSDGGGGEVSGSKISWLLVEGLMPGVTIEDKVFTYTVVVPPSMSGTAVFNGTYRFESIGSSSPILGETQVNVGSAPPGLAAVPAPAPVAYISPPSASSPTPAAYQPPPTSAYAPAPSAYAAPEPTPSPVAYTPPAPEPAYEPEPYVPPVAGGYAPVPDVYVPVPDTSAPVAAPEAPAYEAPAPAYGSAPPTTDFQLPPSDSPLPTTDYQQPAADYPPPTTDAVSPTSYVEPPTKTPWLWIVAGVIAVGGGIYLKQHLKQGVPAGGQHFSQQSVSYYIEQYSKLGYSKEQIISHLAKNGVPIDAVKQGISEYEKAHQVKAG